MPKQEIKGPVSDEKSVVPIPKQAIDKAFSGPTLQNIFVATEAKPGIPVSTRIPPSLNRLVEELVLHPRLPWTDKSDFIRSAIYVVAKEVTQLAKTQGFDVGKLAPFLSKLQALQLEAERHLALKRTNDVVADINESIEPYFEESAWDDLLDTLEEYAKVLNGMPDGFYAQLAVVKFFRQGNIAKALEVFKAQKMNLSPNLRLALRRFRGLRK